MRSFDESDSSDREFSGPHRVARRPSQERPTNEGVVTDCELIGLMRDAATAACQSAGESWQGAANRIKQFADELLAVHG